MRALRALLLALIPMFFLLACSPVPPKDDFAYANAPFTARVRGTYTPEDGVPRPITAQITVGELLERENPFARSITIVFTAPETLAGITAEAVCETDSGGSTRHTVTFTYSSPYGDMKVSSASEGMAGILRFAEALLPVGDVTSVSPTAKDGTHTVTRATADGAREAVFLFSLEQELPLRVSVRSKGETLDLVITP